MFVEMCDLYTHVRAHGFGADALTDGVFLHVDLREAPIGFLLPENFIAVHLNIRM